MVGEDEFSEPSEEQEHTVERESVEKQFKRCKTANTRVYQTCLSAPYCSKNREKEDRFGEIHRREIQTRERKMYIARNQE